MSITIPERSLAQRLEALEQANRIRFARAELKRDLRAGRICFADVLLDVPEYAHTMKLIDLLLSCPRYGSVKATRLLARVHISMAKTLGVLTERQRLELVQVWRRS